MTQGRNLGAFADNVTSGGKLNVGGINATGTPSSATVLAGDGSWATPSAGAISLISTTTASNSATVDISLSGSYTSFQIIFYNINPASSGNIFIQYTTNAFSGVTTWENTSLSGYSIGGSITNTTTGGVIFTNQVTNSTYKGSGIITLPNPLNSGSAKSYFGLVQGNNGSNGLYTGMIAGINDTTSAINGIRFVAGSGNLTSGTFKLYGIT